MFGLGWWIRDRFDDVKYWVLDKFDSVKDMLGGYSYSSSDIEQQIDVDKVLAEFRDSIQDKVSEAEAECMKSISILFQDLKEKTSTKFPDLIEIVDSEQKKAEKALSGSVMKYVKEHISKNDEKFLKILEMPPGEAKIDALSRKTDKVIEGAKRAFGKKLARYEKHVLNEFTNRLDVRMTNQEVQMRKRIEEMQKLEEEANKGEIDMVALRDSCAPIMESAECIIFILETEIS